MAKKNGNGTDEPLEKQLWKTADKEDDFDFSERFTKLKAEFEKQLEEAELNKRILENLAKVDLPMRSTQTGLKDE